LDQKFCDTADRNIKGSYSRYGKIPENGPHSIAIDHQPFDAEIEVIKASKAGEALGV